MDWPAPIKLSSRRTTGIAAAIRKGKLLFRGIRKSGIPSDPGDLGIGTYFTTLKARAKCYGEVTEKTVQLQNPFVVSNEVAYDIIAERFMTCRGTNESRKVGATAATRVLKCLGFDGVVSVNTGMKEWEVVVFPCEK